MADFVAPTEVRSGDLTRSKATPEFLTPTDKAEVEDKFLRLKPEEYNNVSS